MNVKNLQIKEENKISIQTSLQDQIQESTQLAVFSEHTLLASELKPFSYEFAPLYFVEPQVKFIVERTFNKK